MKSKHLFLLLGILLVFSFLSGCTGNPQILLELSSSVPFFTQEGEKITFTYTVSNPGDKSFKNITFNSQPPRIITCPSDLTLPPGESLTCTFVYTVTANNISTGKITIKDTVKGYFTAGCCGSNCGSSLKFRESEDEIILLNGEELLLELTIESQPESFTKAGEEIQYEFNVKNIGNVVSTEPILIQDNLLKVTCPSGNIAPGDVMVCNAVYTSTAADVTSGVIRNTALASSGVVLSKEVTHEVLFFPQPALSLAISINPDFYSAVGDSIAFTYEVTNSGNVFLDGPFTIKPDTQISWNCPETETLAPGSSLSCSGTYLISQSDFGFDLTHIATITGMWNTLVVESLPANIIIPFNLPPPPQQITISGNTGVAGATLSYTDGSPKTVTADASGNYSLTVSYYWSGTVTPSKTGYTFTPTNRNYSNVFSDQTGQDYTAVLETFTISGNAGVAGATLSYTDGAAKDSNIRWQRELLVHCILQLVGNGHPLKDRLLLHPDQAHLYQCGYQQGQPGLHCHSSNPHHFSGNAGVAGVTLSYTGWGLPRQQDYPMAAGITRSLYPTTGRERSPPQRQASPSPRSSAPIPMWLPTGSTRTTLPRQ